MKEIPLTQGYVALVDDKDYEWLSQWKWRVSLMRGGSKAVRSAPRVGGGREQNIHMSRQIMDAPSGMPVDHWDHDTLNNQRVNLRVCTSAQNAANRRKSPNCSSQFKGVHWHKGARKWHARIRVDGLLKHLGSFTDELEAALVYNAAALEHFGAFALPNCIQGRKHGECI